MQHADVRDSVAPLVPSDLWKTATSFVSTLTRLLPRVRSPRLPALSADWCRQHEIDSRKH